MRELQQRWVHEPFHCLSPFASGPQWVVLPFIQGLAAEGATTVYQAFVDDQQCCICVLLDWIYRTFKLSYSPQFAPSFASLSKGNLFSQEKIDLLLMETQDLLQKHVGETLLIFTL